MDVILTFFRELSLIGRILVLVAVAMGGHLLVKLVHRIGNRIMAPEAAGPYAIARGRPKVASITTLVVSALTFAIYFGALGLIVAALGQTVTGYLSSVTVV